MCPQRPLTSCCAVRAEVEKKFAVHGHFTVSTLFISRSFPLLPTPHFQPPHLPSTSPPLNLPSPQTLPPTEWCAPTYAVPSVPPPPPPPPPRNPNLAPITRHPQPTLTSFPPASSTSCIRRQLVRKCWSMEGAGQSLIYSQSQALMHPYSRFPPATGMNSFNELLKRHQKEFDAAMAALSQPSLAPQVTRHQPSPIA